MNSLLHPPIVSELHFTANTLPDFWISVTRFGQTAWTKRYLSMIRHDLAAPVSAILAEFDYEDGINYNSRF